MHGYNMCISSGIVLKLQYLYQLLLPCLVQYLPQVPQVPTSVPRETMAASTTRATAWSSARRARSASAAYRSVWAWMRREVRGKGARPLTVVGPCKQVTTLLQPVFDSKYKEPRIVFTWLYIILWTIEYYYIGQLLLLCKIFVIKLLMMFF